MEDLFIRFKGINILSHWNRLLGIIESTQSISKSLVPIAVSPILLSLLNSSIFLSSQKKTNLYFHEIIKKNSYRCLYFISNHGKIFSGTKIKSLINSLNWAKLSSAFSMVCPPYDLGFILFFKNLSYRRTHLFSISKIYTKFFTLPCCILQKEWLPWVKI